MLYHMQIAAKFFRLYTDGNKWRLGREQVYQNGQIWNTLNISSDRDSEPSDIILTYYNLQIDTLPVDVISIRLLFPAVRLQ